MKRIIDYSIIFIVLCTVLAFSSCSKPEQPVLYQCPTGEIVEQPNLCPIPKVEEEQLEIKEVEIPQEPVIEEEYVGYDKITPADSLKSITLDKYKIDPYPGNDLIYLENITVTIRNYKKQTIKPHLVVVLGGTSPYQTRPIAVSKSYDYDELPSGYKTTITQDLRRIKLEGNRDLKIIEVNLFDALTNQQIETAKVQFIPEKII